MRREQRLRHRREFGAVYRRGRPFRSELLAVRVLRTGGPCTRFGFAVGRALGNAVTRNRIKRRLREAARSLGVAPGCDVVVNARQGAAEAGYWRLRETLSELMARAGLLEQGEASAK
jgi:ribonuclease P protein component